MRKGRAPFSRRRALIGFGAGQAGLLVPLLALERRMATAGPGIIPFELAGTARAIATDRRDVADVGASSLLGS